PFKKMTMAELKARRDKGLCYNCDDKFYPEHKCKAQFHLILTESVVETTHDSDSKGQVNPQTLRLTSTFKEHQLQVLVDGGSTHNFMQERVVERLNLSVLPTKPFKV
ncbi:hypothetical protein CFOL_v3_31443, partial [Cephalotus follicularis]